MIHVCPECGYNDVIEDKVISGHKEVINMTDKEDRWEDEKYIVDILRYCNVWRTKEVDDGIMEVISCIRSEAAEEAIKNARPLIVCRKGKWAIELYENDEEPIGADWWFWDINGWAKAVIVEDTARTERERILDAVNILITAWSVDHKDWREFDVGYTSALEQVAGMIRKDLTPESATAPDITK